MCQLRLIPVLLAALAACAGCKSDCKDAYGTLLERVDADTNLAPPVKYKVLKAMRGPAQEAAGIAQCQALALTPELLECVDDAEDLAGFAACYGEKGPANANVGDAAPAAPTKPVAKGAPPVKAAPPVVVPGAWIGCENLFGWCPKPA